MGNRSHSEASAAGDHADHDAGPAPGKATHTEQLSPLQGHGAAGLPFLDAIVASSPSGDAPVVQRKKNEFASFNNVDKDPATGLEAHQERAVARLVSSVDAAVATWADQRGGHTTDLIFKGNGDVKLAFKLFRDAYIADANYELLIREAGRRMQSTKIPAYAREIRTFSPTMLLDLKGLLQLEDVEGSHTYEFCPLWGGSLGVSGYGVKAGAVAKTIQVRYTNSNIPGFTWTQRVKLSGIQLGFGISGGKLNPGASASGPGDWETAVGAPRRQYLAPTFFEGADFVNPSASASVSFGPGSVKRGLGSALLIEKGAERLLWDMPAGTGVLDDLEIEAGVDGEMLGEASKNNGLDFKPQGGAEATNEFGDTSLDGEAAIGEGSWDEINNPKPEDNETWVPLHYARVFFETGSAILDPSDDWKTVQKVVDAIKTWDKKPAYRGSIFKVDISGCHSQKWSAYDDQLKALDERRDADGELKPKDMRREGDLLAAKEMENYELAMARARNTHTVFTTFLDRIEQQMVYGVMAKSEVAEPSTHESLSANPYGDRDEDRSATILVSYKIFSKDRQVNWNANPF
jgi:hypothetical protein